MRWRKRATAVDVGEAVREELALAADPYQFSAARIAQGCARGAAQI